MVDVSARSDQGGEDLRGVVMVRWGRRYRWGEMMMVMTIPTIISVMIMRTNRKIVIVEIVGGVGRGV